MIKQATAPRLYPPQVGIRREKDVYPFSHQLKFLRSLNENRSTLSV